jgi:hypothetical protein
MKSLNYRLDKSVKYYFKKMEEMNEKYKYDKLRLYRLF